MNTFLQFVAQDILSTYGTNLQDLVVVFPNKRANLFLNEHLALNADQPLWAPTYMSIADLFRSFSNHQVGDHIMLVCQLYQSYLQVTGRTETDESLDQFFGWGEILLADFDDVDKNMVDAHQLFRNLKELRELDADTRSYLSEEQLEVLGQFFEKFRFDETSLQQRFASLWNVLGQLYDLYNAQLELQGIHYEGALYRKVLNELDDTQLTAKCYLFVGFNVLDKVEEQLFTLLQEKGKARFYWDYDTYYLNLSKKVNPMEAGHFLARNVRKFGNALPDECFQNMRAPKQVEYVSAPTESAQVRYVNPWLQQNLTANAKETAVVLCNEHLLEPVLHVLPDCSINITMGFPLSDTPMFSFVQALCNLYLEGYSIQTNCYRLEHVTQLMLHPYTRLLSEKCTDILDDLRRKKHFLVKPQELQADESLKLLFPELLCDCSPITYVLNAVERVAQEWEKQKEQLDASFSPLYQEALFKTYTLCNRLSNLVEDGLLTVNTKTLCRFLFQLMNSQSIPFHGEPAIGLQVMGVLETRNLDFKNIIMLSVNEGMLPKNGAEASFIPYNLRKAFGMTLIEQKIAVYAYYFYRLLQRAEHVTLLYNNNTQGLQKGEMSRFMQQYLIEHPENHTVQQIALNTPMTADTVQPIEVQKTEEMVSMMLDTNSRHTLSPSALNTYINCPLKYYFKYVTKMEADEEITDEIDVALFGTLFHRCSELVYMEMMRINNGEIRQSYIEDVLKNEAKMMAIVQFALKEHLFLVAAETDLKENTPEYMEYIRKAQMPLLNGSQTIVQSVIFKYLKKLLESDKNIAPFRILGLEKNVKSKITVNIEGKDVTVRIGGNIDRLDEFTTAEGQRTIRVVDYKTSSTPNKAKNIEELFDSTKEHRPYHILQTMYYAIQVDDSGLNPNHLALAPSLFYITQANEEYRPEVCIGNNPVLDFASEYQEEFMDRLKVELHDLYSVKVPFRQTLHEQNCQYCDFKSLCLK